MLSLRSPVSSGEPGSESDACGLRDRKKVAGAGRRSREGEGWSGKDLWGNEGKSGAGRIVRTWNRVFVNRGI